MKEYTEEEKKYILSKITDIEWESISPTLKEIWITIKNKQS